MSKAFAKKSINSLLAAILPSFVGLLAIPLIVKNVGNAKFGIFALALAVIGYSSFLDFGMSRLLSKSSAEGRSKDLTGIYSFSLSLVLIASLALSLVVAALFWFVGYKWLSVNPESLHEIKISLFWVILSTPFVALTGTLRGGLEGMDHFRSANILQILTVTGSLLIPALVSCFVTDLSIAFVALFFFRGLVLCLGVFYIHSLISFHFTLKDSDGILKNSLWISVSSFLSPVLLYSDRLLLSSVYLIKEISFYATPMDLVLRVLVIPQAISRVMLPAFTSSKSSVEDSDKLIRFCFLVLLGTCFPILWILAGLSPLILKLWLNPEMGAQASGFLRVFSLGLLWNSLTWVTFNAVQSHGYFKELTLIQLLSTVIYLAALPFCLPLGLVVVAWLWTLRFVFDTLVFSWFCARKIPQMRGILVRKILILLVTSVLWLPLTIEFFTDLTKVLYTLVVGVLCAVLYWSYLLKKEDRTQITQNFLGVLARTPLG